MNELLNENNSLIYRCLHYFVVELDYEVVIVRGLNNEIWLQNLNEEYKIVRLVFNPIINLEQLELDLLRANQITTKIRAKTFTFRMKVMSFYFEMKKELELPEVKNNILVNVHDINDIVSNKSVMEFFPNIDKKLDFEEEGIELFLKINSDIEEKNARSNKVYADIFKPKVPYVTYALMLINILIFIASIAYGMTTGSRFRIQELFSVHRILIYKDLQIWRLFTAAFVHLNVLHLALNMIVLFQVGRKAETHFGKIKFFLIYMLSAVTGSLLSMAFQDAYSLGASGAIFGILGSLLYFGYYYRIYLSQMLVTEIIPAIILNLAIGFLTPGVDNFAHIGGLIGGVAFTMALGIKDKTSTLDRINGAIITIIILAFFVFLGLKSIEII